MKSMIIAALMVGMTFNSVFALNGMALQTDGAGFNGGGKLFVHYLSDGSKKELSSSKSSGGSFSPDGKKVSFADVANKQIFTCNIDGTGKSKGLASCGTNLAVTYWLPDGYIYFNAHETEIFRVKADGSGQKETFFKSGKEVQHFGPSNDAKRFAWTQPGGYKVMVRDMETGKERTTGGDCQGTMSPDGEYFTRNNGGHAQFSVHKFSDMTVWKNFKHPGGKSNLHRWSHFSQDYVLYTKESGFEGYIHNIKTDQATSAGKGVIWDFYDKEIKDPAVSVSQAHVSTMSTNGILVRSTISDGVVNVFMPSSGSAIAELLTMNGSRISSQTLNGQGWFGMPVSTTNSAVLMLRIKSAQGVTVQRIINK